MAQPKQPSAFNGDNIPATIKANNRWAPWKAIFNEKRGKFDKIPCTTTGYGLSTAKPERWYSYEQALEAFTRNPALFAGVGYVMTGPHGVVGIDLDGCVRDNTIDDWALEVIETLASYTELSPSGKGLRILVEGKIASDWTNHEVGIEVYGGLEPRFLTVTGQRLKVSVHELATPPAEALEGLAQAYAKVKSASNVISLQLPDLIDELDGWPDINGLGLPYQASDFLAEGTTGTDRSRTLFTTSVALYAAGLDDAQVLTVLTNNEHAMEVALSHRRYDHDRALMYLWVEHCQKAKARATSKTATADDFEDISEPKGNVTGIVPAPAKPIRFQFSQAADYLNRRPVQWLIKKVLPQADVGAVFGESGAGKSFLALDLVMAIAAGTPWRGHEVSQGTVAYIVAEGAGGFTTRLRAYAEHHGVDLANLPVHVLGDAPNFLEKADIKDLITATKPLAPRVIVVDTLAQVTAGGNENSGEDMGRALAHCKALGVATGAMVLLVAHSGKDSSRGLRGWSGIKGALDVEILVERSNKYRSATITKMKDGDGEGEEFAFSLASVTVGQDDDGDDITSCVVQHGASVPKAQRKTEPKGAKQQLVMRMAVALTDLPGAVTTSQLVDACVAELPVEDGKRDNRRRDVLRALESLVGANAVSVTGGLVEVL